jgi:anaerobic selenocysteine-containing dehydrogenase
LEGSLRKAASRLLAIRERHGNNAIGMYSGNPLVHDLAFLYVSILRRALASRSIFNPEAVDTLPKIVQTGLMFGGPFLVGVSLPDIERKNYFLIVGANPAISHGSLMTMPDAPGQLPSSTMAKEILTPSEEQMQAMIMLMTNSLRSAANSAQLEAAFPPLDFLLLWIAISTRQSATLI